MDVSGMLAIHDEMTGFKKFLDSEHLQYPVFVPIYSESDKKITFDISPIVLRTYNWLYNRIAAELEKADDRFPIININRELFDEFLNAEFGSDSVNVKVSYGYVSDDDMEYKRDVTELLYIIFDRVGSHLKDEFYNMSKDLFDSVKHVSNTLHTLKVF